MSNIKLISKYNFKTAIQMWGLYRRAFPKSEKKPYWLIRQCRKRGYGETFALLTTEGEFIGLAFTLCVDDIVLLDYFAILEKHRGKGYGQLALKLISEHFKDRPLVLEIEDPNAPSQNREQRLRRAHFYEKCGMKTMNFRVCLFGEDMCILSNQDNIDFPRYHKLFSSVFGSTFSKNVTLLEG